jgi:chromosome segregation ATPase
MVADRLVREPAWGQDPSERAPGARSAGAAETRSPPQQLLPQLMREAARALHAAEARASALEDEMARGAALEQQMEAALRSEQARADAAETRAKAAEERLAAIEKRALAAIRVLERRAEIAEARVHAAESWIERVRSAVASGPDELRGAESARPANTLDALIAS